MTESEIQKISLETAQHMIEVLSKPLAGVTTVTFHRPEVVKKIFAASIAATIESALAATTIAKGK